MAIDSLSADKPLVDPALDALGYAPFAFQLSNSITKIAPSEGIVLGIYGSWGSGKTTALNFVRYYLNQLEEEKRPLVTSFNPWWFSGQEDLTLRFFATLNSTFKKSGVKKLIQVAEKISNFADLVSDAPLPWLSKVVFHSTKKLLEKRGSIDRKKEEVEQALRNQTDKVLVIIDDLDRLTAEEIRQIFRLIKSVANFPNIIYLLAFDKNVVINALRKSQEIPGSEYLEKIIQVPFELPRPDKSDLGRMFFANIDQVLADVPQDRFDMTHWGNVFHKGISPFFNTPRDVIRLINTLSVTYPAVHGEVNPIDFVAIETLRVFTPSVYDVIRQNHDRFAGHSEDLHQNQREQLHAFYDAMLQTLPTKHQATVKDLLKILFPKFESNMIYGTNGLATWRKDYNICSPDYFHVYFRLTLPVGAISNAELEVALGLLDNQEAFTDLLLNHVKEKRPDGQSRVSGFLERLNDCTEDRITEAQITNIIHVFLKIGDKLLLSEEILKHIFDIVDNFLRMEWIIWDLLKRLPGTERFKILKSAISQSDSVSFIVDVVNYLSRQHGKYTNQLPKPEEEWIVSANQLEILEQLTLEKIREAKNNFILIDTPKLPHVMYQWRNLASEEEVQTWAKETVATDEGLAKFLGQFLDKSYSQGLGDAVGKTNYSLDPKQLEPFVSPAEIIERAKALKEQTNLSKREKKAVDCFIRDYEKYQKGKSHDDLF